MSIEGGSVGIGTSIGGISAGVGPVGGGVGIEGAASVSGGLALSDFGSVMGISDIGSIVNEGPVGLIGLENTMPYILDTDLNTFSLAEQIIAEPQAASVVEQAEIIAQAAWEPLNTADILAEADSILFPTQNPLMEKEGVEEANHWLGITEPKVGQISQEIATLISFARNDRWVEPLIVPGVNIQPDVDLQQLPLLEEQVSPSASSQSENRPAAHAVSQVLEQQVPQQQEVEEEVIEKVLVENKEKDLEEEGIETKKFVEDEQASSVRKHDIRAAVSKAKTESIKLGLKGIASWLVAKFMPEEHTGNRSQVVKENGPDGSYTETIEAISGAGEIESFDEAVKRFDLIVEEKKPVKLDKEGKAVGQIDLSRVFKYKFVKPKAEEIIVKRFIKRQVHQSLIQRNDLKTDIKKQEAPEWVSEVGEYKLAV